MKVFAVILMILLTLAGCSQTALKRYPSEEKTSISKELIGVYTGSFDPPTNVHKSIMKLAIDKYHVDKLYIYVNVSGTKDFKTSYLEREAMIHGMLGKDAAKVKIMPVLQENKEAVIAEIDKYSRTVQFSGQDSFDTMPADVVRMRNRKWVVIPRGDAPVNIPDNSNVEVLKPVRETSSSEVRKLILQNRIEEADIDPFVASYIRKTKLYIPLTGEAEEMKVAAYEKMYNSYVRELKKLKPELNLSDLVMPDYLPEQSVGAWPNKFTNMIMTKEGYVGRGADDYRVFSMDLLNKMLADILKVEKKNTNPCNPSELIELFGL